MRRRRTAIVLVITGGALAAASSPLWIVPVSGRTPDFGHPSLAGGSTEREQAGGTARADVAGVASPEVRVRSGRLADLRRGPSEPEPARVSIAAIGLEAQVVAVDLDGRTMEVPQDVSEVGWYRYGATPGGRGSAVLAAHVDSGTQGPGAFYRLGELTRGAEIIVTMEDGGRRRFVAVARRSYPKTALPSGIFRRVGSPGLVLVTCGGNFDTSIGRYTDNVVVYAEPAGG